MPAANADALAGGGGGGGPPRPPPGRSPPGRVELDEPDPAVAVALWERVFVEVRHQGVVAVQPHALAALLLLLLLVRVGEACGAQSSSGEPTCLLA